jgi:hypothetical protein
VLGLRVFLLSLGLSSAVEQSRAIDATWPGGDGVPTPSTRRHRRDAIDATPSTRRHRHA